MASIQGIYLAFFGRPADPLGLAYWEEQTNGGADLSVMLNALSGTEEYQDRFVGMSNEEVIQSIYQMLFGRDAEPDGLAHFLEALENGTQTLGSIAVNILDGAQGSDLAMIENKIAAADLFTASLDTPEEIEAYSGNDAADFGRQFLSTVTEDPETVPTEEAVQEQIDTDLPNYTPDEVAPPAPGGGGGGGTPPPANRTFDLTIEDDSYTGGGGNDTFNAAEAGSLNTGDILDGRSGTDTLRISEGAIASGDVAPTIRNIEIIHNSDINRNVSLQNSTGIKEVWSDFSDAASGEYYRYLGASADMAFGIRDNATDQATISIKIGDGVSDVDEVKVAVSGNEAGSIQAFSVNSMATINKLVINVDDSEGQLSQRNHIKEIVVSGEGNLDYHGENFGTLTNFDATEFVGDVNVFGFKGDISATVETGGGDDTLDFRQATAGIDFNAGAGNDTIIGGKGDDTIDLSAPNSGSDTIIFNTTTGGHDTIVGFRVDDVGDGEEGDILELIGSGREIASILFDENGADGGEPHNTVDVTITFKGGGKVTFEDFISVGTDVGAILGDGFTYVGGDVIGDSETITVTGTGLLDALSDVFGPSLSIA